MVHEQAVFKLTHLPPFWRGVLDTTLCDTVCQSLAAGRWFSPGTPVSSTITGMHGASLWVRAPKTFTSTQTWRESLIKMHT
jgi:hypothetical protein